MQGIPHLHWPHRFHEVIARGFPQVLIPVSQHIKDMDPGLVELVLESSLYTPSGEPLTIRNSNQYHRVAQTQFVYLCTARRLT